MKRKNLGIIVFFVLVAAGVVSLYYYLVTHKSGGRENLTAKKTDVQELIDRDLDTYYPATVRVVMETYSKLCDVLYNEKYSEEEYEKLMKQYRKLLDDELLAKNPENIQLTIMNEEITKYKDDKKNIFSYRFIDDPENKESEIDGKSYATVTMSFGIKKGASSVETTEETFILRKDNKNRWKILGWKLRDKKNVTASPKSNE